MVANAPNTIASTTTRSPKIGFSKPAGSIHQDATEPTVASTRIRFSRTSWMASTSWSVAVRESSSVEAFSSRSFEPSGAR